MAVDIFLKIDDIKGESLDKSHKDEIEILSWSWGLSQTGTSHSGGGAGAGKVNVQDISITKFIDTSSPNLLKSCANGKPYKHALLTVRKAGEKPLEYIKLKLYDVMISSISTSGSGGGDRQTESVSLNFAKYEYTYTPQTATGAGGAGVTVTWNIPANTEALS
jgi:type VI secretion system secreted protein Hcp